MKWDKIEMKMELETNWNDLGRNQPIVVGLFQLEVGAAVCFLFHFL